MSGIAFAIFLIVFVLVVLPVLGCAAMTKAHDAEMRWLNRKRP